MIWWVSTHLTLTRDLQIIQYKTYKDDYQYTLQCGNDLSKFVVYSRTRESLGNTKFIKRWWRQIIWYYYCCRWHSQIVLLSSSGPGPGQVMVRKVRNWPEPYFFLVFTHPPPPPPTQTFFLAKLAGLGLNRSDGPIWVGMTQVGSEEVRTSRPRQRPIKTTGGTSGSTSMSLNLSDSFMKS